MGGKDKSFYAVVCVFTLHSNLQIVRLPPTYHHRDLRHCTGAEIHSLRGRGMLKKHTYSPLVERSHIPSETLYTYSGCFCLCAAFHTNKRNEL